MYKSIIKGEERIDIRYFISSLPLGIEQFSKAVRRHRGAEFAFVADDKSEAEIFLWIKLNYIARP